MSKLEHAALRANLPKQILPKGGHDLPGICFRCGKPVDLHKGAMLEQDGRIAEWHDFGMPPNVSQGAILFGMDCAKAMRKRARFYLESDPASDEPKLTYLTRIKGDLKKSAASASGQSKECYDFFLMVIDLQLSEPTDNH